MGSKLCSLPIRSQNRPSKRTSSHQDLVGTCIFSEVSSKDSKISFWKNAPPDTQRWSVCCRQKTLQRPIAIGVSHLRERSSKSRRRLDGIDRIGRFGSRIDSNHRRFLGPLLWVRLLLSTKPFKYYYKGYPKSIKRRHLHFFSCLASHRSKFVWRSWFRHGINVVIRRFTPS